MKKNPQSIEYNNKSENIEGLLNNNGTASLPHTYQIKPLAQLLPQLNKFYNYETIILGQAPKEVSDADLADAKLSEEI
jgi:hypothetical protein